MNRATLAEVQRLRCYPSITLLMNTTPGAPLTPSERDTAQGFLQQLDDRLEGDVSDALRLSLTTRLANLVDEQAGERSTHAVAMFVSPEYAAAVRLGSAVDERVTRVRRPGPATSTTGSEPTIRVDHCPRSSPASTGPFANSRRT